MKLDPKNSIHQLIQWAQEIERALSFLKCPTCAAQPCPQCGYLLNSEVAESSDT